MRRIRVLIATVAVAAATAAPATAQIITNDDVTSARAGVRVGYGGHGPDVDVSIDSRRFGDLLRLRADVGHGHWLGINSLGNEPMVTRLAASALLYIPSRTAPDYLRAYVGLGVGVYVPRAADFDTQTGGRIILGMEGSGDRWSVGPEVEIDLTRWEGQYSGYELLPTFRIGVAVRRRF